MTTSSATEKLLALEAAWHTQVAREGQLEQEQANARVEAERVKEALTAAYARTELGDDSAGIEVAQLTKELRAAVDVVAKPWPLKLAAARRAADERRAEVDRFRGEHLEALGLELEPRALAAQGRLRAALQEVLDARAEWIGVAAAYSALTQGLQGWESRDVADDVIGPLAQQVERELAGQEASPWRQNVEGGPPSPKPWKPLLRATAEDEAEELEEAGRSDLDLGSVADPDALSPRRRRMG